jgi:hypothetical protein
MGLWTELFRVDNSPSKIRDIPKTPTLYDEQIPNSFNLGWFYSEDKNQYQMAKISNVDRNSHFYVIGSTGVGKSKFLEYLIMQDILEGRGVGVVDPHGDLIEHLKGYLAVGYGVSDTKIEALMNNIILIDPTDPNYTVSFNPLEKLPGVPAAEQVNELVSSFKKIWADSWGNRMEDLLRNSLICLSEAELPLTDLSALLSKKSFREAVLRKVENPVAREYFDRFNALGYRVQVTWAESTMNKMNAVFADERIRQIFSSKKSTFNLREAMDTGKVVLVKLDKGRLKDAANLLGALIVAQMQIAAFSRSNVPEKDRTPFYLYLDEFQNFASDSFSTILSEARKYGLYVCMAHQILSQIDNDLRDLILSCAGIQVYFRLNRQDASLLAKEAFQHGEGWEDGIAELQNLPLRVFYAKNKIQGGIVPIETVAMENPYKLLEPEMGEDEFREHVNRLPFGGKYLVERKAPTVIEESQTTLPKLPYPKHEETKQTNPPKPFHSPIPQAKGDVVNAKKTISDPLAKQPGEAFSNRAEQQMDPPVMEHTIQAREKGSSRHQYLQTLIKRAAEEKGYKATIEEPVPDGRVDVGLLKGGKKIACEISVTTNAEHEFSNIEKCLKAGYDQVFMCSQDKRNLEKIRALVMKNLDDSETNKVLFMEPEELLFHLEEEAASESTEERVKGYKVKVNYQPVRIEEKNIKREAVAQVIAGAFKRLKRKD